MSWLAQAATLDDMPDTGDEATLGKHGAIVTEATKKADAALAAAMADPAQAANAAKLKELQGIWEQFKATRDKEIIPALYAGDKAKASEPGKCIQADRFKKITGLLDELRKK
jgi:hypothetical protein